MDHYGAPLEELTIEELREVAYRPKQQTPPQLLRILASSPDFEVRRNVAYNPDTPMEVLWELAHCGNMLMRAEVCANNVVPVEWLEYFANDQSLHVQLEIADHPKTPQPVLAQIAQFAKDWRIKRVLARNPHTAPVIMRNLYHECISRGWDNEYRFIGDALMSNPAWIQYLQNHFVELELESYNLINKLPVIVD